MFSTTAKRLVAGTFVGGIVALSPVVAPAANAAPVAAAKCSYSAPVTTTTTLTLSPSTVARGQQFTATAKVTASPASAPVPTGTVVFKYKGDTQTATLVGGSASVTYTSRGPGAVKATYQGVCAGGISSIGSSKSGPSILGEEASRGNGGGNGNGGVAGTDAGIGGLAATGLDNQTELFGVLGAGMVTVGGLALLVHRRRVQA